ncbi:VOC family protein [Clostridiaceae bacterium M8S5]|nr:VOC family protein [Clostridiaceae bacterium M8S5]
MKVSHILYKVNELDKAVEEWRDKGFVVEYGKEKNPYNALIYFTNGPYIELFQNSGMPNIVKKILKLLGKSALVNQIEYWENAGEGLIGVAIENYKDNLDDELAILKKYKHKYFKMNSKRMDTKGNLLKFKVAFPYNLKIPFLMTYFNIDPKPFNFIHPNGIEGISSITFGTDKELIPLIKELCDDPILKLYHGSEVKDMEFIKKNKEA